MRQTAAIALFLLVAVSGPACAQDLQDGTVTTDAGPVRVEILTEELEHPWAVTFLPDGRMLVTERPGRLRVVTADGELSQPLSGIPDVFAEGQGGLLDVALAPDFESSRLVYLSYAEPGDGGTAGTSVARGRLAEDATGLEDLEVIFRQEPKVAGGNHFGSRLAFADDGTLFVTLGERFEFDPAQDLGSHLGAVVRINPDGSVPEDNPFVDSDGARREIWSYGHRNVEAAAVHPETGELWIAEMGPRGGDELNRPQAGRNYGWPLVSWGQHYGGENIPDPPTRPDLAGSAHHWTPVISPSGMHVYTGDLFPEWQGSLLIGGLSAAAIVRVTLDGDEFAGEERIDLGSRIRDVEQGPDGAVFAVTDEDRGKILRLTPDDDGS